MNTVVFDFDGVIHSYRSGWKGVNAIPDPPVNGIREVIEELRSKGYEVVIVSTRSSSEEGLHAIEDWLDYYGIVVDRIEKIKPPALVYIDDRAIRFKGPNHCKLLVPEIEQFKPGMSEVLYNAKK